MRTLTELELDALREVANIALSRAAVQLSEILQEEVLVEVLRVELQSSAQIRAMADEEPGSDVVSIHENLNGALNGRAHLILLHESSRELVLALLGNVPVVDDLDLGMMEHEAIKEMGNIIISSAVARLAELIGPIQVSLPEFEQGNISEVLEMDQETAAEETAPHIVVETRLIAAQRNVTGLMILTLTVRSLESLMQGLLFGHEGESG